MAPTRPTIANLTGTASSWRAPLFEWLWARSLAKAGPLMTTPDGHYVTPSCGRSCAIVWSVREASLRAAPEGQWSEHTGGESAGTNQSGGLLTKRGWWHRSDNLQKGAVECKR
jgi:hypothetical protein